MNETTLKTEWEEAYNQASMVWMEWWREAKRDLQHYLGDQWSAEDKRYLAEQRRNAFVFNKIKRAVELVDGYHRKNALSLRIQPVEQSSDPQVAYLQDKTASQLSQIVMFLMQWGGGYQVINEAFSGALKTGMNLIRVYMDYTDDLIDGDVKFMRVAYNQFLCDPWFTKLDLSDCSYVLFREYISKEEAIALFPSKAKEIKKMIPIDADEKFMFLKPEKDVLGNPKLAFDEFFKRTTKKVKVIVDRQTGNYEEVETVETSKRRIEDLAATIPGFDERFMVLERWKPTVEHTVWLNKELMYNGAEAFGLDDFPFVPVVAYFDPEYDDMKYRIQSYVRIMIDPQQEVNRRRSKFIDILDTQIASGWKAKEGSVVDPEDLYRSGQAKVIWIKKDANLNDIEQLRSADAPAGLVSLIQLLDKDIMEIPGGNAELYGAPEVDNMEISGVLAKLRVGMGLTIMQSLFDNLRWSKKILGNKLVKLIQENFSPTKVARIVKEQPTPEFYNKSFGKYDCVPVEGVLTDTQKQMYFTQLLYLKEKFPDCPIPWSVIFDAAPIENKEKIIEQINNLEQKQQQMQQLQMAMQLLAMKREQAKLTTETASAQEKIAKAKYNTAVAFDEFMQAIQKMEKSKSDVIKDLIEISQSLEQWLESGKKQPELIPNNVSRETLPENMTGFQGVNATQIPEAGSGQIIPTSPPKRRVRITKR